MILNISKQHVSNCYKSGNLYLCRILTSHHNPYKTKYLLLESNEKINYNNQITALVPNSVYELEDILISSNPCNRL